MFSHKLLNPKQRFYLILAITGLGVAVLSLVIIKPSLKEVKRLSDEIYEQRIELEKLYLKGKVLKQTLTDYIAIKPELENLSQIYVTRGNELSFITALEDAAGSRNLEQRITLNTQATKDSNTLLLELSINSNLQSFLNYLGGVEGLDYYINIESIRLTGQTDGNGKQTVTGLLGAKAYYK